MMDYDVVVIGSGVGGGCIALTLADTGARILILERGERLPREPQNWDAEAVFGELRYRTHDTWHDGAGARVSSRTVLLRRRPHQVLWRGHVPLPRTATSRRWSTKKASRPRGRSAMRTSSPTTIEAERLFGVHGRPATIRPSRRAQAPTRFRRSRTSRCSPTCSSASVRRGLKPFHMPAAVDFHPGGKCVRCGTCDAFPCRIDAKGDAETRLIDPALRHPNVTLADRQPGDAAASPTTAASASSRRKSSAAARSRRIRARLFVLSAGAINSARAAAALSRAHVIRTGWPTLPARSGATT